MLKSSAMLKLIYLFLLRVILNPAILGQRRTFGMILLAMQHHYEKEFAEMLHIEQSIVSHLYLNEFGGQVPPDLFPSLYQRMQTPYEKLNESEKADLRQDVFRLAIPFVLTLSNESRASQSTNDVCFFVDEIESVSIQISRNPAFADFLKEQYCMFFIGALGEYRSHRRRFTGKQIQLALDEASNRFVAMLRFQEE